MSYLKDAAIDIINAAKTAKSSGKESEFKIFQLGQIKEILLYRQKDLLPVLLNDVFSFMTDRNANVRKFLVRLSSDLFSQDPHSVLPKMLELYQLLISDSNDSVLSVMVKEASKLYSKIVLHIASIPDSNDQEASMLWGTFKAILNKFQDFLVSSRSDHLKLNCIRLIEEQILFAVSSMSSSTDPRIARRDPRLSRTSQTPATNNNTAEAISLHHAIVSRNALQKEAEELITKLSTWILKGGPVNYPLSPNLQANIAQILAAVGTVRPGHGLQAAKLVTQFITEKSSIINQVDSSHIEHLARTAMRLSRASSIYASDPEGQMHKLKAAVNSLNITTTENEVTTTAKKREISEISGTEEDDLMVDDEAYRSSVINALNAAEAARREQQERAAAAAQSLFQSKSSNVESEVGFDQNTELSSDILSIETSALRFSTVLISVKNHTDLAADEDLVCNPVPPTDGKEYNDLSIFSLLKLLENYVPAFLSGESAVNQYKEIMTRTIMSMIITAIGNESYTNVKIISTWSKNLNKSDFEGIPATASVPRGLWLFVSFALQTADSIDQQQDMSLKVEFLIKLCNDIADCCEQNWDNKDGFDALSAIHESSVLAIMCRMLQIPHLRELCKTFLLGLHKIPLSCVRLLKLLVYTGTDGSRDSHTASRYRGTKGDALSLLAHLVAFSEDIDVATECLQYLLWNTLNDDFELRSRAVNVIVNELMMQNDWCNDRIFCFAIQSLATSAGIRKSLHVDHDDGSSGHTLRYALSDGQYDHGKSFGGHFEDCFQNSVTEDFPKAFHFFNSLCSVNHTLLSVYMEIYATATSGEMPDYSSADVLLGLIKTSLKAIIPAIQRILADLDPDPAHEIFDLMKTVNDLRTRPLMAYILHLLHTDVSQPAKAHLIESVYNYVSGAELSIQQGFLPIDSIQKDDDFKLFLPLISGLSADLIEKCLPRIIRIHGEDIEGLESVFNRIIKARPPPMTKSNLLVALHRINIEQHDLKTKILTQAIAICQNRPTDFNAAVIKETLQTLLDDEVPPVVLMRTALLSASSFPEIKKFVLEKLIPSLIQRSVWVSAPKVWEGVMVGADNLSSGNVGKAIMDPTLNSIMRIPGNILKSALKVTKNLKRALAKYLQSLSVTEREEIVSSRSSADNLSESPQDNDKKKILKELLSFNPDAASAPVSSK